MELFLGPILSRIIPIGRAATLLTTTEIVKARLSWRVREHISASTHYCKMETYRFNILPVDASSSRSSRFIGIIVVVT
jgi:hypothetical protein